ncbi:MAG: hypothetical protein ACSHWN_02535 [Methylophilaceae bacterium]
MIATPIIIDIEASGFGKGSYPIEIGYVDRHGKAWCSLITPCEEWAHWNAVAEDLHHIKRELLFSHGKSIDFVANHLNTVFLNQTIYSDGWLHDFTWLSRLFDKANVSPHFKLEDLRTILTPHQAATWHHTKQSILDELQITRHRASADAKVLQLTWQKTGKSEAPVYA